MASLMEALTKGGGASSSPIHVTLSERKCSDVYLVIVPNSGPVVSQGVTGPPACQIPCIDCDVRFL